ncbi:MAG: hypothetical protein AAF221_08545 [Pseudomonadota bacterium]
MIAPPPLIVGATRLAAIPRETLVHHVVFHQLKTAKQDTRRNPLWKAFSFRNEVRFSKRDTVSFVLLEEYIKSSFDAYFSDLKPNSFFLPHPIAKASEDIVLAPKSKPVKVGFVGQARPEKGFLEFLAMAEALSSPDIEFHVIGHLLDAVHDFDLSSLATKPTAAKIPQAQFAAALASVDCIVQPLSAAYGEYSSGTILDAVAYEKPLFCFENRIMQSQAERGQPIGFMANTLDALIDAVRDFALRQDEDQVNAWRRNMQLMKEERSTQSLAALYRRYVTGMKA